MLSKELTFRHGQEKETNEQSTLYVQLNKSDIGTCRKSTAPQTYTQTEQTSLTYVNSRSFKLTY